MKLKNFSLVFLMLITSIFAQNVDDISYDIDLEKYFNRLSQRSQLNQDKSLDQIVGYLNQNDRELFSSQQSSFWLIDNYTLQKWISSSWQNDSSQVYAYNQNNLISEKRMRNWDGVRWIDIGRYQYLYDQVLNLHIQTFQNYESSNWVNLRQSVYEYNQLGLLSTGTTYVWNNSGWENSVLWTSTYNSNSEIIQEVFQTWDGTTWENAERTVYEYFPNSIIITFDISLFGAWINLLRLVANNDSNGHPYEIKIQIWLFGWENLNRSLLTYDNNYNEIQNLNQDWDFDISDWVNSTLITSTYTSENLLNDVLTESWSANSYWINSSFKTYNYDQHLNRIETIKQSWNGNNWSNSEREVFEYLEVTSVEEPAISPKEYKLIGNYPNPFNPTTTIKFYVPELSNVTLNVYNAIGEKVAVLLSTELATGTYELKWNSVGLPSGIYFCQLKTEGFVETKKMILLK